MQATQRDREDVQTWRQQFLSEVEKIPSNNLHFIDESGIHIAMTRERARALKGKRAIGKVKRNHGTVTSVLGSLTAGGVEAAMTIKGGTSGPVFVTFVEHFLLPNLQPGHVVVLDNVGAHKVKKAKELVESKGAKFLYLPPYHPDLNPIENAWSKIKSRLRAAEARTHETLEEALKNAINSVTPTDATGWMTHCGYQIK